MDFFPLFTSNAYPYITKFLIIFVCNHNPAKMVHQSNIFLWKGNTFKFSNLESKAISNPIYNDNSMGSSFTLNVIFVPWIRYQTVSDDEAPVLELW